MRHTMVLFGNGTLGSSSRSRVSKRCSILTALISRALFCFTSTRFVHTPLFTQTHRLNFVASNAPFCQRFASLFFVAVCFIAQVWFCCFTRTRGIRFSAIFMLTMFSQEFEEFGMFLLQKLFGCEMVYFESDLESWK